MYVWNLYFHVIFIFNAQRVGIGLYRQSISTLIKLIKWMTADLTHVDNQRYTKNIIMFVRVNL